jgi:hypothetical protein
MAVASRSLERSLMDAVRASAVSIPCRSRSGAASLRYTLVLRALDLGLDWTPRST